MHVHDLPRFNGHSSAADVTFDLSQSDPLVAFGEQLVKQGLLEQGDIMRRKQGEGRDFFSHHELGAIMSVEDTAIQGALECDWSHAEAIKHGDVCRRGSRRSWRRRTAWCWLRRLATRRWRRVRGEVIKKASNILGTYGERSNPLAQGIGFTCQVFKGGAFKRDELFDLALVLGQYLFFNVEAFLLAAHSLQKIGVFTNGGGERC